MNQGAVTKKTKKKPAEKKKSLPLTCMYSSFKACLQGCLIEEHLTHCTFMSLKKKNRQPAAAAGVLRASPPRENRKQKLAVRRV
jgi:hypothetical protein